MLTKCIAHDSWSSSHKILSCISSLRTSLSLISMLPAKHNMGRLKISLSIKAHYFSPTESFQVFKAWYYLVLFSWLLFRLEITACSFLLCTRFDNMHLISANLWYWKIRNGQQKLWSYAWILLPNVSKEVILLFPVLKQ